MRRMFECKLDAANHSSWKSQNLVAVDSQPKPMLGLSLAFSVAAVWARWTSAISRLVQTLTSPRTWHIYFFLFTSHRNTESVCVCVLPVCFALPIFALLVIHPPVHHPSRLPLIGTQPFGSINFYSFLFINSTFERFAFVWSPVVTLLKKVKYCLFACWPPDGSESYCVIFDSTSKFEIRNSKFESMLGYSFSKLIILLISNKSSSFHVFRPVVTFHYKWRPSQINFKVYCISVRSSFLYLFVSFLHLIYIIKSFVLDR